MASSHSSSATLWRPLRSPTFRNLILADVASDVGSFMQGVGAAWLMVSLNAGPMYVALTQTAASLPFFILALPAGAVGDIVDRRKVILATEAWMVVVAVALTVVTFAGRMSPGLLLFLTFALAAGDAFESPTWRAILPELVEKDDLPAASALNGIEFNVSRAVGPALGGLVIAVAGIGTAFLINTLSFVGVILVIARWKRPVRKRATPPETVTGATIAALRYVRYSPQVRVVMFRAGAAMFFASALMALLPSVAHDISGNPIGYGVLLGCFGTGAVLGALALQYTRERWPTGVIVSAGIAIFGFTSIATAMLHVLWQLGALMLIGGAAWVSFISLFNVLLLNQTPDWVRARVLAISLLITQGAVAVGSALWGSLAARSGVATALLWAGVGALAAAAVGLFFRMPEASLDLTPWNHWKMPPAFGGDPDASGPVLVTVEYRVDPEREHDFLQAMHQYGRIRRRDGASRWGICRDLEIADRYVETFVVSSWAEHLRQHERITRADNELEQRLRGCIRERPTVRHLLYL